MTESIVIFTNKGMHRYYGKPEGVERVVNLIVESRCALWAYGLQKSTLNPKAGVVIASNFSRIPITDDPTIGVVLPWFYTYDHILENGPKLRG